jgi:uncharacterized protein (TIGR03437 family)
MKNLLLAVLLCVISSTLPAQNLRVVNAASLSSVSVAPGSIVTIFGTKLATGVAFADDVKNPPTTLGGVTVTIGGAPAALFYVAPEQINAVVNPATPSGAETIAINSPAGNQTGTVTVSANAPPGLFSLFGTGTRDGAILNAITFLLGDFSTRTANSPTFLALFATGMNLSSPPTVTIGGVPVTVTFAGASPCCAGLQQINIMLPDSLAGAGRVPVVVTANGQTSNTVQVVLLPPASSRQFPDDEDNKKRNRELAALAAVPGTSLVLSTDQNDDVVRVIDVSTRQVTHIISLAEGANPIGVAVNAAGTIAVVAESGRSKVAILDLVKFTVTGEVATGAGPSAVAIGGTQAVVVDQDADSVSIVDFSSATLQKTLPVGRGPFGVAVDAAAKKAYVTNEDDGTVSVIDMAGLSVAQTLPLGASERPESIALVPGAGVAVITVPGAGPQGKVILLNLATGKTTEVSANPDGSGGSSDVVVANGKVFFANQAGGSISILPVTAAGAPSGPITTIKVDLGARAMALDAKDNILVVSNEGTGTLVLVSLASNSVAGRINGVRMGDGDDSDDRSDRGKSSNAPAVQSLSPASARAGTTFTLTIAGVNLTGATDVTFSSNNGEGDDTGKGGDFTVKNVTASADGKQVTASVTIAASAKPGARTVLVKTPNGESATKGVGAAVFVVLP